MNPFKYGDPVTGEYYLHREGLKKSVVTFLANSINVVLIGPRRFGKTSFILDLQASLKASGYETVFVDVFNVTSHRDFLNQLLAATAQKKSFIRKVKEWVTSQRQPELTFSAESDGTPNMTLSLQTHKLTDDQVKRLISEAFDSLAGLSKKTFVAFDEFQTIGQLQDNGWLEATIRTKMQLLKGVSFLFSGSRHGMIHDMFNNSARPFYRSCQLIDFPRFGDEFTDWIMSRFDSVEIKCDRAAITHLRKSVDDTPNYVQMCCFQLVAQEIQNVGMIEVEDSLRRVTSQNSYAYQTILNSLTPVQQRVLRLAACEGKAIYSKDVLEKYEIRSGAHVSQAINSLISKQILDESTGNGVVVFDDPLFRIWLKYEFGQNRHQSR